MKAILLIIGAQSFLRAQYWDQMPETDEQFQNDYCSFLHSQFVIDRIKSEVDPILDKYDVVLLQDGDLCLLNNFGEYEE